MTQKKKPKARIDNCDQRHVIQPKKTDDVNFPFVGSFSPNGNVKLSKTDDTELPRFVFLYVNVIDPTTIISNDSFQETNFRLTAYDSGKFFIKLMEYLYIFFSILIIM